MDQIIMARLFSIFISLLMAACTGGAPSSPTATPPEVLNEEDIQLPDSEPLPPADPTGPPAAETLTLVKYLLAPCASPFSSTTVSRMKIGADLLEVKDAPEKKTIIVNGTPLWEVTPLASTSFEFDIDVKLLTAEKVHADYLCNTVVTSFLDDTNDKIQRHTMTLDTNGVQPELSWHRREENGKPFVHKIEITVPGASPTILQ